ncbi:MAG TPA: HEAT repeat domain-containing protein [Verrucomicrobiae bacterium]|nr:HEAT repeat domain-containing protein [Verrucomicrobiae bacterium]
MTLADILKQLPETDREIQAKEPPPQTPEEQKRRRRDQYPDSWGNASKFSGPDPALARKLVAEVFAGGRDRIIELIRILDSPADYKPEYLLHCLAILGNEKDQRLLVRTMSTQLGTSQARAILIRELQFIGSDDAVKALAKYLSDDNSCDDVARALTAIGSNTAAAEFRKAFPKSTGKCRVTIAQNLGVFRDTKSVDLLRAALRESEPDLRLVAGWALARIGDAQSADALIKTADSAQGHPRAKATSTVLLLAETLAMQGKKSEAARIYNHLLNTRTDPAEKYVRDAAARHITVFML